MSTLDETKLIGVESKSTMLLISGKLAESPSTTTTILPFWLAQSSLLTTSSQYKYNMVATKLSSALVAPSKVANLLDWRKAVGSVMALDITRTSIGMSIATHPDQHAEAIALRPISLLQQHQHHDHHHHHPTYRIGEDSASPPPYCKTRSKPQVSKEIISELEAAVRRHRVCAFVVHWPTHEGRMGEQCGKVLQVLDSVIDQSNSVVTRKRPFTLWSPTTAIHNSISNTNINEEDGHLSSLSSCTSYSPPDEWGRSIHFANAPTYFPDMYYSSKSLIRRQESLLLSSSFASSDVAAHVLDEWRKNHWEMDSKMGCNMPVTKKSIPHYCRHSVDEYNSEKACLQSALL